MSVVAVFSTKKRDAERNFALGDIHSAILPGAIIRRCTYPKIEVSKMRPILDGRNQPSFRPIEHWLNSQQMSPKLGRTKRY